MARQRRVNEFGVLMLFHQLSNVGFSQLPPVTLLTILAQGGLYMGLIPVTWNAYDVCLSAQAVLKWREYHRLLLSTFEHADDMHLYYNMVSFLFKGMTLERHFGSVYFAYMLAVFSLLINVVYVGLQYLAADFFEDTSYLKTCSVGFSGVIFALKVLTTYYWNRDGSRRIYGVRVPTKYAVWAELVLIQIAVPNASFVGHLAGILVGILYTQGPLKFIMDLPFSSVTSQPDTSYTDDDYDEALRRSWESMQNPQYADIDREEIRRRRAERFSFN